MSLAPLARAAATLLGAAALTLGSTLVAPAVQAAPPTTAGTPVAQVTGAAATSRVAQESSGGRTSRFQDRHFRQARTAWRRTATAPSADRDVYLRRAVRRLVAAPGPRYHHRIHQLRALVRLPSTYLTPSELRRARYLVRQLNGFFRTR